VDQLRAAMAWASRQVLAGYEIRTGGHLEKPGG
jgi:hypothetical protein